jgi:hypothetical protein
MLADGFQAERQRLLAENSLKGIFAVAGSAVGQHVSDTRVNAGSRLRRSAFAAPSTPSRPRGEWVRRRLRSH